MLLAQIGTTAVLFFLRSTQGDAMQDEGLLNEVFHYVVSGVALIMPVSGWFISKKSLKSIKEHDSLSDKLSKYQSGLLLKYAFYEGPTIFAAVAYFLTGNFLFLGISLGLIAVFLLHIPTRSRLFMDVPLSLVEESKLNDPEAEVVETLVND